MFHISFFESNEENQIKTNHEPGSFLFVEKRNNRYRPGIYGAVTN
jgi:hypothetical protein